MDKISPAFSRTLSIWGRCPAYRPLHQKTVNHKKTKESRARVPMTLHCPWTTGQLFLCFTSKFGSDLFKFLAFHSCRSIQSSGLQYFALPIVRLGFTGSQYTKVSHLTKKNSFFNCFLSIFKLIPPLRGSLEVLYRVLCTPEQKSTKRYISFCILVHSNCFLQHNQKKS